jgi:hypothetical protein
MHGSPRRHAVVCFILIALGVIRHATAADSPTVPPAPRITGLLAVPSGQDASGHVGLNDKLAVVVDPAPAHPAGEYVLFLNGSEVQGLAPPHNVPLPNGQRALVFKLVRNSDNDLFWRGVLGSPKGSQVRLAVALGERLEPCVSSQPCKSPEITIRGNDVNGRPLTFDFTVISWPWLAVSVALVAVAVGLVWGRARTSSILRDNLLPQIPPELQTYSLGRWQMAFWFVLVFASFIFLYVLLWDYNTVSPQALALMGISSATALASVAVDAKKESPADAVNRALQALGLYTHDDVKRLEEELAARKPQEQRAQADFATQAAAATRAHHDAAAAPGDASLAKAAQDASQGATIAESRLQQLQAEIQDRLNILRAYQDKTGPFVSEGWLKDLISDINGPTLHRIQVLLWTLALGLVFIVGVYRYLAMPPDFSTTLLALMGLSGAGYVGFKWPEKNS